MANITNLTQFRKQKARAQKRADGDANAAKFGRTKAQKALEAAQQEHHRSRLDQALRDTPHDDGIERS